MRTDYVRNSYYGAYLPENLWNEYLIGSYWTKLKPLKLLAMLEAEGWVRTVKFEEEKSQIRYIKTTSCPELSRKFIHDFLISKKIPPKM